MQYEINGTSRLPIYQQLVQQVREAVARGDLKPQEQLPSVRQLSRDLLVNPNTIAQAARPRASWAFTRVRTPCCTSTAATSATNAPDDTFTAAWTTEAPRAAPAARRLRPISETTPPTAPRAATTHGLRTDATPLLSADPAGPAATALAWLSWPLEPAPVAADAVATHPPVAVVVVVVLGGAVVLPTTTSA